MERAELTEPFRLLLDGGKALAYQTGAEASQIDAEATNPAGCDVADADRSLPSSVLMATYGATSDDLDKNTRRDETNTSRQISLTGRGVNSGVLVGDTGLEPVTSAV